MRKIILAATVLFTFSASSQSNTSSDIIEGGKTLVELVKVLKMPKHALAQQNTVEKKDSCLLKNISDLCFKNSSAKNIYVSLVKRNGNAYESNVLTMMVLPKNQECWYELKSGIYKFKIETDGEDDERVLYREGEMKLAACENLLNEIKF